MFRSRKSAKAARDEADASVKRRLARLDVLHSESLVPMVASNAETPPVECADSLEPRMPLAESPVSATEAI